MKTELITHIIPICCKSDARASEKEETIPHYGRVIMSPLIVASDQSHWVKVIRPRDNSGTILGFKLLFDSNMALNQFIESDDIMLMDWVWLYSERSYSFWESIRHRVNQPRRKDELLTA
jgi:hypothetical protein